MIFVVSAFRMWNTNASQLSLIMLKEARHSIIVDAVNEKKYVSISDLMVLTNSSESTIRADLIELDREGKIFRLRGGAQAINDETISYELSVEQKMGIQWQQKRDIARFANTLIPANSLLYVDAGTSTLALMEILDAPGLVIVTNSVLIARKALAKGYRSYVIGGELKLSTDALFGPLALSALEKFRFDIGFFGTNGVDLKQGFTTPDVEEASIKGKAMDQCKKCFVLADSSKFGVVTAVSFHPFEGATIITETITKEKYKDKGILEAKA